MLLRPRQAQAQDDMRAAFRRVRRVLLNAHTAFGKSTMTGSMLSQTKKTVLYICPQEQLMQRVCDDLRGAGIEHGIIHGTKGALPNTYRVHVSLPKTIANRLGNLPMFDWIISDEAHLAGSDTWDSVLAHFGKSWHLGMSATPCRLDGRPLGKYFDEIVYGPSVKESTASGYLVPFRVFAPPAPGIEHGATARLSLDSAAGALNTAAITGSAIAEYRARAMGRKALYFTCNRQHSESVAREFRDAGIPAVSVDSTMGDVKERFRDFERGPVQVLVNVGLATTGYDYPPVSLIGLLRDTESVALAIQIWGRGARISPNTGKQDCLIHDHVGMVMRHGLPDADREWTLEGRERRPKAPAVRQCPKCWACFTPAAKCPSCGAVLGGAGKARSSAVQRSGELEEVTEAELAAAKEKRRDELKAAMRSCVTISDFNEVGKRFGFKHGWGFVQYGIAKKHKRVAA